MATEIGVISVVVGTVTAISADGVVRTLQPGDKVSVNDVITTGSDGAVELMFSDGSVMDLGRNSQTLLDSEVFAPSTTSDDLQEQEDIDAIQQAILKGQDPTFVTDAPSATDTISDGNHDYNDIDEVPIQHFAPEVIPQVESDVEGVSTDVFSSRGFLLAGQTGQEDQSLQGLSDPYTSVIPTKITLSDLTVNEGSNTASISLSVDSPVVGSAFVVTLSNGATVTIPVGETSAESTPFDVQVNDSYISPDSYTVSISGTSGGSYMLLDTSDTATVTISDTIDTTTVTLNDVSVDEDGTITYSASVDNAPETDLTITLDNGVTITIAAGATSGSSAPQDAQGDDVYVDAESYTVSIDSTTGGNYEKLDTTDTATVTISDTVDTSTVTLNDVSVDEDGSITYSASVDNAPETDLTITLDNGVTITIAAGATSGSSAPQDAQGEDVYVDAESYTVSIDSTSGGNYEKLNTTDTATVTISDTIDTTTVTLNDVTVNEDETITYSASVDNAPETDLTLTLNNGVTITIAAGATTGNSSAQPAQGDDVYSDSESNTISIASSTGGNYESLDISDTATITISDTVDTSTVTLNDVSVNEDETITYSASVDNAPETDLILTLNNGVTITIAAGATTGNSSAQPAQGDDVYSDSESNTISIASSTGGNYESLDISDTATVTISDTVNTVTATLSTTTTEIAEDGGDIEYTITLTGSPGSVVPEQDLVFTLANGEEITISSGNTSGSVTKTYTDAEITNQSSISNSISSVSGGSEYEKLTTSGSTDVDVNYVPVITNENGVTVDEDDLSNGTDTDKESTTQFGTFTISSEDAIEDLTIAGNAIISGGTFTTTSFTTGMGNTLSVSAYNSETGVVSYSYTLNGNATHADADGENSIHEDLSIKLTDTDGSEATDTLTIVITDDAPVAVNDAASTASDTASGNVITDTMTGDAVGADGATVTNISFGSIVSDVSTSAATTIAGDYGSLNIQSNGSYSYTVTAGIALSGGEKDSFTYTITDGDGDTSTATLAIDVNNTAPSSATGQGVGSEDSTGITVTLSATDTDGSIDHFIVKDLPTNGTLYSGGTAVSAGDSITATSNSAQLSFVPDADWSGDTSFNFEAIDNHAVSTGSTSATISVSPVTDAPTIQLYTKDITESGSSSHDTKYALIVSAQATDTDQSEGINAITIKVPDGVTLSAGTEGTSSDGMTTWELPSSSSGSYNYSYDDATDTVVIEGLTMTVPSTVTGGVTVTAEVTAQDGSAATQTASDAELVQGVSDQTQFLEGSFVNNTSPSSKDLRLTFSDLTNPANTYSTFITAENAGITTNFKLDTGFIIDDSHQYLVIVSARYEYREFDITDFMLEGVSIGDATGHIKLGVAGTDMNDHEGFTQVIQPDTGVIGDVDGTYSIDTVPTNIPTTEQAQAGASVPMADGSASTSGDTLTGLNGGMNVISAGYYNDTVTGGNADDILFGGDLDDSLSGGDGRDVLYGEFHQDTLNGNAGDDMLYGGWGNDIIYGGDGDDLLVGGIDNDELYGGAGDDVIYGDRNDDVYYPNPNMDIIIGGSGNDILTGGTGPDTFRWSAGDDGTTSTPASDIVKDFNSSTDKTADGDVLDIANLLVGEEAGDLTNYLSVEQTDFNVVINITPSGSGDVTQKITLENTTLNELGADPTASQTDIINSLISNGHIHVDS